MSFLVPSRAHTKFHFSRSRSDRSRSLDELLFLVLVVLKSGHTLFRSKYDLGRTLTIWNDQERHRSGTWLCCCAEAWLQTRF